jgi:transcriptional regulator with XRE-family HTH domain
MDAKKFSERLSLCMKQNGLNGAELSSISGVTTATISRYLNGLRVPTVDNIIQLADALNVSVDYLLGLHDVPDDKILISAYSVASCDDKRVLWTLLERYGGKHGTTDR